MVTQHLEVTSHYNCLFYPNANQKSLFKHIHLQCVTFCLIWARSFVLFSGLKFKFCVKTLFPCIASDSRLEVHKNEISLFLHSKHPYFPFKLPFHKSAKNYQIHYQTWIVFSLWFQIWNSRSHMFLENMYSFDTVKYQLKLVRNKSHRAIETKNLQRQIGIKQLMTI